MRNIRQIKKISAIYMRILEGEGVQENPYRDEEYIYFDDEDRLFVIDREKGGLKPVEEKEPRPVIANGTEYDSYADYLKSREEKE